MGKNVTVNEPANALWDLLWEIGDHMSGMSAELEAVGKELRGAGDERNGEVAFCAGKLQAYAVCLKAAAGQQAAHRHGE